MSRRFWRKRLNQSYSVRSRHISSSSQIDWWHYIRLFCVATLLMLGLLGLVWRMIDLAIFDRRFLVNQSRSRNLRVIKVPAHRGMIVDRNGVPLAISTPLDSVWVNPKLYKASAQESKQLAYLLHISMQSLVHRIATHSKRDFVYIKRDINPNVAKTIRALRMPGVFFNREYQRYYPQGSVTAQLLGLTNIDDQGQEGLELAYNKWLQGIPGKQLVLEDRLGNPVENLQQLRKPYPGHNLVLSIDERIQYLAFRALQIGLARSNAKSGSAIVLDTKTNEVLALVNSPTYNPNKHPRPSFSSGLYRNRAVTDIFEPGSTIKPFSIASALESGKFTPQTTVDTNPGRFIVDGNLILDEHLNYGVITVSQVLEKSSNIGTAKIILSLPPNHLVNFLRHLGFGKLTQSNFPGEISGLFPYRKIWSPFRLATLSFGYSIGVTTLQLARAYSTLADGGILRKITFLKQEEPIQGERVMTQHTAEQIITMLEKVVSKQGTGYQAHVLGYQVAGKTGTAYIAGIHGYNKHRYIASFVGIGPFPHPRFVVAVVVREPNLSMHYGGLVAAPVFSRIMEGTLRLLNN